VVEVAGSWHQFAVTSRSLQSHRKRKVRRQPEFAFFYFPQRNHLSTGKAGVIGSAKHFPKYSFMKMTLSGSEQVSVKC